MLIIRKKQMETFKQHEREQFRKRMVQCLKEKHPDEFENDSDRDMFEFVDLGIEKASRYHIENEVGVAMFIDRMAMYGHDFDVNDDYPWARKILNDPEIPGDHKMYEIKIIGLDMQVYGGL